MVKCKKYVYKNRIRLNEFFRDYDKLRCGFIFPNQFLSGLNMGGLHRYLNATELQTLADAYTSQKGMSLFQVDYRAFCTDVDNVFTRAELEKRPLEEVPREPTELLDKERFRRAARVLSGAEESALDDIIRHISDITKRRGVLVKPFFDDAARNKNSSIMVGHVTEKQFRQTLDVNMQLSLPTSAVDLLIKKYFNEDYPEMVNYMAFSCTVDPPETPYNPYSY